MLKLLHEALNRSGDHYSIEYGSSQRRSLGSFKRQLHGGGGSSSGSESASSSSNTLDTQVLEGFLTSPHKKRRHSDSNMMLTLPSPRGNMKGSLSLEGEARVEEGASRVPGAPQHLWRNTRESITSSQCPPPQPAARPHSPLDWRDPFTPSPSSSPCKYVNTSQDSQTRQCEEQTSAKTDNLPSPGGEQRACDAATHVIVKCAANKPSFEEPPPLLPTQMSVESVEADVQSIASSQTKSQDSVDFSSVFSDDPSEAQVNQ